MRPDIAGFLAARRNGTKTYLEDCGETFLADLLQKLRSGFPIGRDELQALRNLADRVESINLELSFQDEECHRLQRLQAALGTWPNYHRDLGLLPGDLLQSTFETPKGEVLPPE